MDAVAARGGPRKGKFSSGACEINREMFEVCQDPAEAHHPSRLGPVIAYLWSREYPGLKAFNYDTVFSNELSDLARISGTPLCELHYGDVGRWR